jgi:Transcriptional regulator PadR-like family
VGGANAFGEFIKSAFGAEVANVIPLPTDPERVVHAEARIGTGMLYFADSGADGGRCLRSPTEPVHVQLWTTVPDAEAATRGRWAPAPDRRWRSLPRTTAAGWAASSTRSARCGGSPRRPEDRLGGQRRMSAVRLLMLGAVRRRGRAHGYQVRADLEAWGAHEWSSATSGSVYHALKAMTGQGLLVVHETTPSVAGRHRRASPAGLRSGDLGPGRRGHRVVAAHRRRPRGMDPPADPAPGARCVPHGRRELAQLTADRETGAPWASRRAWRRRWPGGSLRAR